jgi:hypothetical protein
MTTTAASPFLSDAVEPQYVDGPAARYAGLAGRGFAERIDLPFLLGTARTSDHTPAKPLGYVLHFLVGPAFAAQTLAAHLAYGTLVGGFFSLAG